MDIITICSHCKCVQSIHGHWMHNVKIREGYKDSNFDISHGICNECMPKYYPEQDKIIKDKK